MSDLPLCPNCKAEQKIKGENDTHWAFRCPYCSTTRIISKPTQRGISRLEVELNRRHYREKYDRFMDSLPAYSFPSTKEKS